MADWRSRGKGGDPDMDDEPVRRQRGRRGHGRGSRGFDSRPEFGGPEDFGFPADFVPPPDMGGEQYGRDNNRGGYGRDNDHGDRGGYNRDRGGFDRGPDRGDRDRGERGGYARAGDDRPGGGYRPSGPRGDAPTPQASAERGPRQSGTVKFFKADKGFGFITPDEGSVDVFVHISAVERSGLTGLESGQRLSFATEPDRRGKGPKAVELQLEDGGA